MNAPRGTFAEWTDRLRAYTEYIGTLGKYKVDAAKAELTRAQTAGQLQRVEAMRLLVAQLERDLRQMVRFRSQMQRRIQQIGDRAKKARHVLRGRRISGTLFAQAFSAYEWFALEVMQVDSERLYSIQIPQAARRASNFINNRTGGDCDPLDDSVETAVGLAAWLKEKRYMAKTGHAHRVLGRLFGEINSFAGETTSELRSRIEKMQDRTYNAWTPQGILGVPNVAAAKSIEGAGAREA